VKAELDKAEQGATELDTGLHPHGSRWWRYRYEHSYVESLLMIFISVLMLFWSRLMTHLKHHVKIWSLRTGEEPKSQIEEMDEEMHGTFYSLWMRQFCEQMMVCILVYLTVWVMCKTHLIHFLLVVIKPTPDMHVPHTEEVYQEMAFDLCTIFFMAIFLYFCLMLPVAHDTRDITRALEDVDSGSEFQHLSTTPSLSGAMGLRHATSGKVMGRLSVTAEGLDKTRHHFVKHMHEEMKTRQEPEMKEIVRLLNSDISAFPLWKYLTLNIRLTVSTLLEFSWAMWLPVIASFMVFVLFHRFAHMGYVRIMIGFSVLLLAIVVFMALYTKGQSERLRVDSEPHVTTGAIHAYVNIETVVLYAFQFTLIFLCYGVARMICQPWMWRLHFWTVLCITIASCVQAFLFIFLVSPGIPCFSAVMALPPHLDHRNLAIMLHVAKTVKLTSAGS